MPALRLTLALTVSSVLAGCAVLPFDQRPVVGGKSSIQLRARLDAGAYRTQSQELLPYGAGDVQHVVFKLFKVVSATEIALLGPDLQPVSKDVPQAQLGDPIGFYNLHPNTTYCIRAYAYKSAGVATDDLISVEASSSLEVLVGIDERPTAADLSIQLMNRLFRAEATAGISVTDGGLDVLDETITPGLPG